MDVERAEARAQTQVEVEVEVEVSIVPYHHSQAAMGLYTTRFRSSWMTASTEVKSLKSSDPRSLCSHWFHAVPGLRPKRSQDVGLNARCILVHSPPIDEADKIQNTGYRMGQCSELTSFPAQNSVNSFPISPNL